MILRVPDWPPRITKKSWAAIFVEHFTNHSSLLNTVGNCVRHFGKSKLAVIKRYSIKHNLISDVFFFFFSLLAGRPNVRREQFVA